MYPQVLCVSKNTGDITFRPIVSDRGPATYEVAKELASILKPLRGKFPLPYKEHKKLCISGPQHKT